jgi:hypothetical protein
MTMSPQLCWVPDPVVWLDPPPLLSPGPSTTTLPPQAATARVIVQVPSHATSLFIVARV